ncbi:YhcH/YjgK/YiaL family protein [Alkalibacter rhizosphaerae]|uniref:YhcH/YjgK/YiaL family protein n=1 Tax=Alkalibacter rhizosphaerae TaxID=2815577 RepID=A0A974XNP9_9FIRM|nr:YhcH/YjgK/YiaL family protein [Alkalibacter rhizosphaerae]QSX09211.1 YhcH/YjgK/YiaL family protein [Alkalibacter rhizosphaerae]
MICSSIYSAFDLEWYPRPVRDAVQFFQRASFQEMEPGEYEIDGRDVYFQVIDLETKPWEEGKPEVHRKYIDIQFLFQGKETIGFVDDSGKNKVSENLLEQRDLLFYEEVQDLKKIDMKPGDFCVFYPSDVHVPGCEREGIIKIRKIVYKINVDFYKKEVGKEEI